MAASRDKAAATTEREEPRHKRDMVHYWRWE